MSYLFVLHMDLPNSHKTILRAAVEGCGGTVVKTTGDGLMAELQAATRLATLHRGTPREQESLQQLRDVYNSFTEDHDTVQLVAARTVLDTASV
jgi:class 3 adenylate cyclase